MGSMGSCWCLVAASMLTLSACREPSATPPPLDPAYADDSEGGVASTDSFERGHGGVGSRASNSSWRSTLPAAPDAAAGGSGDAVDSNTGCGAQPVTLDEIHAGRVRGRVAVSPPELVATSQKFLVSEAKSGSCLWGAFAAERGRTGAGSGLFLVSFGPPHAQAEGCIPGADGLPNDLAPGDVLEVEGTFDDYAPASCSGVTPAQQLRVDVACPVRRRGSIAAPEPALVDVAFATRLATGDDAQLLRDWGGALIRIEGVSAAKDRDDGDAVFPFGVVRLEQTSLEVHSRLYYFDLREGGPRTLAKAPRYRYPTVFQSVVGVLFLDYCSWVLAPRDRCSDLSPESDNCPPQARRP